MVICLFFAGCNSIPIKTAPDIPTTISKKIEDTPIKETSIQELMISQKLVYFLAPLVLSLFSSIVLVFLGNRLVGLGILVSSITCIILVISLATYMKLVAILGLIILLIGIYFLFREIYNKSKTQDELVHSMTIAKTLIDEQKRDILKKTLNDIQNKNTQKVVKIIKGKNGSIK